MNIDLSLENESFITEKIRSGQFDSAEEVVGAALRIMDENEHISKKKLEALRHEISKAELQYDNGQFITIGSYDELSDLGRSIMERGRERLADQRHSR